MRIDMGGNNWWGLVVNGKLTQVIWSSCRPTVFDFDTCIFSDFSYDVVPVNVSVD